MKAQAIRPGDKFKQINTGWIWEVTRDHSFGNVEVFCRDRKLHGNKYKKDLRDVSRYERLTTIPPASEFQLAGRTDYHDGKGCRDCPYDPLSLFGNHWLTGWWSEYYKENQP